MSASNPTFWSMAWLCWQGPLVGRLNQSALLPAALPTNTWLGTPTRPPGPPSPYGMCACATSSSAARSYDSAHCCSSGHGSCSLGGRM